MKNAQRLSLAARFRPAPLFSLGAAAGFAMLPCPAPADSTNLWLEIHSPSNAITLTLHGTDPASYLILSSTNLAPRSWRVEQEWLGTEGQTDSQVLLPLKECPALFFTVGSGEDADGDGLPDAYEQWVTSTDPLLADTGDTGVSDGYKDADGDGWPNVEEFSRQMDPNRADTRPPPAGFEARLDEAGGRVLLSWDTADGPVQGYVVTKISPFHAPQVTRVSASTQALVDAPADHYSTSYFPPYYLLQADYGDGVVSAPASASALQGRLAMHGQVARAPGSYRLVLSAPPAELAGVRLFWEYVDPETFELVFPVLDLPRSAFTNGVAVLPTERLRPYLDSGLWLQGRGSNGQLGPIAFAGFLGDWTDLAPSDLRGPLRDNLNFLLRSATATRPFEFYSSIELGGLVYPYLRRSAASAEYEFAGFTYFFPDPEDPLAGDLVLAPRRVLAENHLWRNFVFATNDFELDGRWRTGAGYDTLKQMRFIQNPAYWLGGDVPDFDAVPSLLASPVAGWIYARSVGGFASGDPRVLSELGLRLTANGRVVLEPGARNFYGLAFTSAQVQTNNGLGATGFVTLRPNEPERLAANSAWHYFLETELPQLETVGYHFAPVRRGFDGGPEVAPVVPGMPQFSLTNTSSLLITSVGQPLTVAGYALQRLVNGDSAKRAYLGQQFDAAYKADDYGAPTTAETGLLSEYGEFFPTEPGLALLTTKPDAPPNLAVPVGAAAAAPAPAPPGRAPVHVIALCTDANRDGVMDPSFTGPDHTSRQRPFRFWINDDDDAGDIAGTDLPGERGKRADGYYSGTEPGFFGIDGVRDLIDFFPVALHLRSLLQVLPPSEVAPSVQYVLRHEEGALNMVYAGVLADQPRRYLTDVERWRTF